MSAHVTLVNKTSARVTFGLWSAPDDHSATKEVAAKDSDVVTLGHYNARVIGVWTDGNTLYPSNKAPLTTGGYFRDNGEYTVTLTHDQITIGEA